MVMPLPEMVYVGKAHQVIPGITSWCDLAARAGIVLEVWAGSNRFHNAIDVYHRIVLCNVRTPNRFWHNIVFGCGTEPVYWMHAKEIVRSVRGLQGNQFREAQRLEIVMFMTTSRWWASRS